MTTALARAIIDCIEAVEERGVQDATIVIEDDGTPTYIPGAYLNDASYTGSRAAIVTIREGADLFGPEFDYSALTEEELEANAEWAAEAYGDEWYREIDE